MELPALVQFFEAGLRGLEDFREGVEAFGAKCKPSFRGT